jgi:multidrug efflux system membrane fusion protein
VPVELDAIGTVTPVADVAVKSQIEGAIAEVHFREGQEVKPGDPLFTLDPRSFEAALAQAQANLARDRAQAERSRVDAERQTKLFAEGVASKQVLDTVRTQANVDAGAVRAGEAAVRKAELDLEHTRIAAPIGGRVGSLLVHEGDVVKADDTELVTLNQIAPIDVRFTVPEQQLPAVQGALAAGPVPVTAHPGGSAEPPETGQVVFVDNAVDRTTGTIALKARFENAQRHLWPGQYVDVVMRIGTRADAVVVPEQAVQAGQDGALVFVVGAGDKAEVRKVRVDLTHRGQTVIAEGVAPGERVVVDGQLRLSPGAAVTVDEAPARVAGQPDGRS